MYILEKKKALSLGYILNIFLKAAAFLRNKNKSVNYKANAWCHYSCSQKIRHQFREHSVPSDKRRMKIVNLKLILKAHPIIFGFHT